MKKAIFTKLIVVIGILFSSFVSLTCAKSSGNENDALKSDISSEPVTVVVELKKDSRINASIKQKPDLNYSTELAEEQIGVSIWNQ